MHARCTGPVIEGRAAARHGLSLTWPHISGLSDLPVPRLQNQDMQGDGFDGEDAEYEG